MNEQKVFQILGKVGAVITNNHIVYTSGKHGSTYINKDAIFPHTKETSALCRAIAELFVEDMVDVVIAPAISGCILSSRVAEHLTNLTNREVLSVYAEKRKIEVRFSSIEEFVIKRGYDKLVADKRILAVEDVLTTGRSVKEVIEAVRTVRGNVIGLGAFVNRGGVTPKDVADVPKLISLVNLELNVYNEADCPLCAQGVPINIEVGHGKDYLERRRAVKNKFVSG